MTCAELRELAAAHALGALEPAEQAEVERHLTTPGSHDGCREAVDRARATVGALAGALPEVKPDPRVWEAIEIRTGLLRPRFPGRVGKVGWAAVAAAVALLGVVQVERLELHRQRDEARQARAAAEVAAAERDRLRGALEAAQVTTALARDALALLDLPGTRLVAMDPQPGQSARAVALVNAADGRAVVASTALPPQPGKTYQLWVIRGKAAPRPAGFMRTAAGVAAGEVDPSLLAGGAPDALAVSLEPPGGSAAPTQVLLVGKVTG